MTISEAGARWAHGSLAEGRRADLLVWRSPRRYAGSHTDRRLISRTEPRAHVDGIRGADGAGAVCLSRPGMTRPIRRPSSSVSAPAASRLYHFGPRSRDPSLGVYGWCSRAIGDVDVRGLGSRRNRAHIPSARAALDDGTIAERVKGAQTGARIRSPILAALSREEQHMSRVSRQAALVGFSIGTAWVLAAFAWRLWEYRDRPAYHWAGLGVITAALAWLLWPLGLYAEVAVQKHIQLRNRRPR